MDLKLRAPTLQDCFDVIPWRNACREGLRTSEPCTHASQDEFFTRLRSTKSMRYFSVVEVLDNPIPIGQPLPTKLVGFVGLTNIDLANGSAEVSLLTNPERQGEGIGQRCFDMILKEGFGLMGLDRIYGEVYVCNGAFGFWEKQVRRYSMETATLPLRKRWMGSVWGSLYFVVTVEQWKSKGGVG